MENLELENLGILSMCLKAFNSEFSVLGIVQNGKPLSLINVLQRKLRGIHLRVLGIVQNEKL